MSHFQINTTQWRELLNNYRQNRCPQQSFLVEKVNKYFPTSVWQHWDEVIRNPAILNKVSKAADIDEVYNMAKQAVRKSGQFSLYGVILNESDIDKLYSYIVK